MKIKAIREMESGHLQHELAEKQKHLYKLRTQAVTEKLENPSQLRTTRREIAKIKTIQKQRELAGAATASPAAATVSKVEGQA
jgi:large subunit ribosomal protein L29